MNRLLLFVVVALPEIAQCSQRTCHAVSPAATDEWCNSNCNHSPPNCPPALCQCDGPGPSPGPTPPGPTPKGAAFVGGYLNIAVKDGLLRMKALASNADTIPITRLWLAFASPTMVYTPGSKTLASAGFGIPTTAADAGYSDMADAVAKLEAAGVEVFVSMGGWNYNCFPYFYARYSVGGYGTHTPNFWKVTEFGGGKIDGCTPENQYCWTCEPQSEGTDLDLSFAVFPEPSNTSSFKAAQKFVEASAGSPKPKWHPQFLGGQMIDDEKRSGTQVKVPGNSAFAQQGRDPYQDLVYLAKDLGASGVDVDYEEFWHADYFKTGKMPGPFKLDQTVYKYAAILKDVKDAIVASAPELKMSTAAGAVGAWSGKWWGGNLKGVWLGVYKKYPEVMKFMSEGANAGGINVMTYDLSNNEEFHECPKPGLDTLDKQVDFYMNTYKTAGLAANVGYEIGIPAYPDRNHDPSHQMPCSKDELSKLISGTQSKVGGGFFWELYKPAEGQASPTEVAQAICNQVLPGSKRCKGTIPQVQDVAIV